MVWLYFYKSFLTSVGFATVWMGGNRRTRGWFELISFLALPGPQPDSCKFEHKVLWHMFCSLWEETPWGAVLQRIKALLCPLNCSGKPSDRLRSVTAA